MQQPFDVLIIGSGAAGLSTALHLAPQAKIAVISKGPITLSSTFYAQGGIAAVMGDDDSVESHINDTLATGGGLCHENAVRFTVENAPEAIRWLIAGGVKFTQEKLVDGKLHYHLTREGGHSHRRVMHADDATGQAIEGSLVDLVKRSQNIQIFKNHTAVDLVKDQTGRVVGAYILDNESKDVKTFVAKSVVLATGGASKVYLYTSNPDCACGDGVAMAWRAGCRVANLEFNQFHPTCLYHPQAKSLLISEAVRGEGGQLLLPDGTRFMPKFDKRAELAPRDIVARAIDHEMKRLGLDCVYLDISHRGVEFVRKHFPNICKSCKQYGFDLTREPIPVVPAAHYTCGGVMTDLNGQTDVPGLYAVGEVAFTGLHGANRMASNSLLECLVFAKSASTKILTQLSSIPLVENLKPWDESRVTQSEEEVVVAHNWDALRRLMWNYVGIVRNNQRLRRAQKRLQLLHQEVQDYYSHFRINKDLCELRNLVLVAQLIVESALKRQESRGLHYNLDYPQRDDVHWQCDTILRAEDPASLRRSSAAQLI